MMNYNTIDVYITISDRENYLEQCVRSLDNQPCNIHFNQYQSTAGKARYDAFTRAGSAKYVCFVDPDDYLIDEPLTKALYLLEQAGEDRSAYYSNHWVLSNEKKIKTWFSELSEPTSLKNIRDMHHIVIHKRDNIEKCIDLVRLSRTREWKIQNLYSLYDAPVIGDMTCHYAWRRDTEKNDHGGTHKRFAKKKKNQRSYGPPKLLKEAYNIMEEKIKQKYGN